MGPSHVFVLFASLATCAMGMYPNANTAQTSGGTAAAPAPGATSPTGAAGSSPNYNVLYNAAAQRSPAQSFPGQTPGSMYSQYGQPSSPYGSAAQYGARPQYGSPYGYRPQQQPYGAYNPYASRGMSPYGGYNQMPYSGYYNNMMSRGSPYARPSWGAPSPYSGYPGMGAYYNPRSSSFLGRGARNTTTTMPPRRVNPFVAFMGLQRKENMNNNLMQYYKNRYGCVEGLEYTPNAFRMHHAGRFFSGCNARANESCMMATIKRNPQVHMLRRIMSPQQKEQVEMMLNSKDMYTYFGMADQLKKQGKKVPQPNFMARRGAAGAGAAGAGAAGAAGAAGMMGAMSAMPGMSQFGRAFGNMGQAMGQAMYMQDIMGMELSEAREKYLPYTCQEIGQGFLKMGMCCPGQVPVLPLHQRMLYARA